MRVNTVLEEVEVSGQLGRKEGVVRLGGSDYERLLVSVVESTLKRRHEVRVYPPAHTSTYPAHSSSTAQCCLASVAS